MIDALLVGIGTFWLVGLAEFGDKTHLVTLSVMARTKQPWIVAIGSILGIVSVTIISVILGTILGDNLPTRVVTILAGILFIAIGLLSLLLKYNSNSPTDTNEIDNDNEKIDETQTSENEDTRKIRILRQAAVLVALAEFGDKSQLVILTAATASFPLAVFIGGSLGMAMIFVLSALFGEILVERVDKDILEYAAVILFIIAGTWLLVT